MEYPKFKVCVRSYTYNQSAYITDTMNGFVLQETNYPFVCCIVDDCSTDGEQDVIRKYFMANFSTEEASFEQETSYATILYAQHKTNKNCYFAVLLLKENYYSKQQSFKKLEYIKPWRDGCTYDALCEGDDYWIHPHKLQMQTDFLDSHEDYVMCHTRYKTNQYGNISVVPICTRDDSQYTRDIILNGNCCGTLTVMFRSDVYDSLPRLWEGQGFLMGDVPSWIELSTKGKIGYLPEITAEYNYCDESASHSNNLKKRVRFIMNSLEITMFYNEKLGLNLKIDKKPYYFDAFRAMLHQLAKKIIGKKGIKKMKQIRGDYR